MKIFNNYGFNSVSDKTSTLPNGNSDKSEEFNMGLKENLGDFPKSNASHLTSLNPDIRRNLKKC